MQKLFFGGGGGGGGGGAPLYISAPPAAGVPQRHCVGNDNDGGLFAF